MNDIDVSLAERRALLADGQLRGSRRRTRRLIAQDPATGPIPLAAAHAADGLQKLLGVIAAGQVPDVDNVRHGQSEMRAARECFEATIANIDILLSMLAGLDALFDD